MAVDELSIILAAVLAVVLTFVWIGIHCFGVVRLLGMEEPTLSRRVVAAWVISFVGGFTGPCVFLASIVSLGLALAERRSASRGESSTASGTIAGVTALASATILVMVVGMMGLIGLGMVLGG